MDPSKLQIRYDKLNTKYNRIWEQLTNIGLFVLASFIALAIAYVQYNLDYRLSFNAFLIKIIWLIIGIAVLISIISGCLFTLLVLTGRDLHSLLRKNKIID